MKHLATVLLILFVATSAFATGRITVPSNPNAYNNNGTSPDVDGSEYATIVESRDTMIFFDAAEFVGILDPDYYFDDFSYLDWGTINQESYQFGPVNGYSYTVTAPQGVFSIPGAVSTNYPFDPIVITFDGDPVFAVGGDFFATDFDGNPIPAVITVSLNDGTTVDLELPAVFVGFASDQAITQLTITTPETGINTWCTFDNFYVGQAGVVAADLVTWGSIKALYE